MANGYLRDAVMRAAKGMALDVDMDAIFAEIDKAIVHIQNDWRRPNSGLGITSTQVAGVILHMVRMNRELQQQIDELNARLSRHLIAGRGGQGGE